MKAKLLRKLRKQAHKKYGMLVYNHTTAGIVYVVGMRKHLQKLKEAGRYDADTLEKAKKRLEDIRRVFILDEVYEKRLDNFVLEKQSEISKL